MGLRTSALGDCARAQHGDVQGRSVGLCKGIAWDPTGTRRVAAEQVAVLGRRVGLRKGVARGGTRGAACGSARA